MTRNVNVEVSDEVYEYLEEWSDAIGCSVGDVAADTIENELEDHL